MNLKSIIEIMWIAISILLWFIGVVIQNTFLVHSAIDLILLGICFMLSNKLDELGDKING